MSPRFLDQKFQKVKTFKVRIVEILDVPFHTCLFLLPLVLKELVSIKPPRLGPGACWRIKEIESHEFPSHLRDRADA